MAPHPFSKLNQTYLYEKIMLKNFLTKIIRTIVKKVQSKLIIVNCFGHEYRVAAGK